MTENKKEWVTPELIVLVRSNPEEAVLSGCKDSGLSGLHNTYFNCLETCIGACTSISAS